MREEAGGVDEAALASPRGAGAEADAAALLPLWQRWAAARAPQDRDQLAAAYAPLVRRIAARCYRRRASRELAFADFVQHGNVGLLEAIERYDTTRSVRFESYAQHRIEGAILNGVQTLSELQQQVTVRRQVLQERAKSLASATPDPRSALERLAELAIGLALGFVLEDAGQVLEGERTTPDNAYARVEMRQLRQEVAALVQSLPDQERLVIHRHYFQQVRFDEIAAALKLTKGRVSQIHHAGLARLRQLQAERGRRQKAVVEA